MEDVATIVYLGVLVMNLSIYKQHAMKWRILVVCIEGGRVNDCSVDVFADLERKTEECLINPSTVTCSGVGILGSTIVAGVVSFLTRRKLFLAETAASLGRLECLF
jgi:hypothetical protein